MAAFLEFLLLTFACSKKFKLHVLFIVFPLFFRLYGFAINNISFSFTALTCEMTGLKQLKQIGQFVGLIVTPNR